MVRHVDLSKYKDEDQIIYKYTSTDKKGIERKHELCIPGDLEEVVDAIKEFKVKEYKARQRRTQRRHNSWLALVILVFTMCLLIWKK